MEVPQNHRPCSTFLIKSSSYRNNPLTFRRLFLPLIFAHFFLPCFCPNLIKKESHKNICNFVQCVRWKITCFSDFHWLMCTHLVMLFILNFSLLFASLLFVRNDFIYFFWKNYCTKLLFKPQHVIYYHELLRR